MSINSMHSYSSKDDDENWTDDDFTEKCIICENEEAFNEDDWTEEIKAKAEESQMTEEMGNASLEAALAYNIEKE